MQKMSIPWQAWESSNKRVGGRSNRGGSKGRKKEVSCGGSHRKWHQDLGIPWRAGKGWTKRVRERSNRGRSKGVTPHKLPCISCRSHQVHVFTLDIHNSPQSFGSVAVLIPVRCHDVILLICCSVATALTII
jgi:hypothetical protein